MNRWSAHPKHQPTPPTPIRSIPTQPLSDKYQLRQFITSILNIHALSQLDHTKQTNNQYHCEHNNGILAAHINRIPVSESEQIGEKEGRSRSRRGGIGFNEHNNTSFTKQQQQSRVETAIKQYSTVSKQSRLHNYTPPTTQPQQMESLIDQFLTDLKPQPPPQTQIQPVQQQIQTKSQQPQQVKVHKIDLNSRKTNHSIGKSTVKQTTNKKDIISKGNKNNYKIGKETPTKMIEVKQYQTPHISVTPPKQTTTTYKQQKTPKYNNNVYKQVEIVRVEHCQPNMSNTPSKNNLREQKIAMENKHKHQNQPQINNNIGEHHDSQSNGIGYSALRKQTQKQSYLQQKQPNHTYNHNNSNHNYSNHTYSNKHSTHSYSHTTAKLQKSFASKTDHSHTSKADPSHTSKKPIKIQIEIPLQQYQSQQSIDRINNYNVESEIAFAGQQTQIIKQISQKVMALIRKTKDITPDHK